MKGLAALVLFSSILGGCSSGLSIADLKSGKIQGTVVKKSIEKTSFVSTMAGGPPQVIWQWRYYLDVKDDTGILQHLEVGSQAYHAVEEGTPLPLEDHPSP